MSFIQSYNSALESTTKLEIFIDSRFDEIYDYYLVSNHEKLIEERDIFQSLALHSQKVALLDFSQPKNEAYLNLILNTAVRLNEPFVFEHFLVILTNENLQQSKVLKASALYMNSKKGSEFLLKYPLILNFLEQAYLTESDSKKEPVAFLINYFATAILHFAEFNESLIKQIKKLLRTSYKNKTHSFLADEILEKILGISTNFRNNPYDKIKAVLDEYLERGQNQSRYVKGLLIESGTQYARIMNSKYHSMHDIFQLNRNIYYSLRNASKIFNSLGRGTNILEEEEQLTVYMSQLGPMHIKKLEDAFSGLPSDFNNLELYDWGCGQAPASKMFIEKYTGSVNSVTLIEPSLLALKRATLHIKNDMNEIISINKKFDDLEANDFLENKKDIVKVHIFSNVIDMELFKLNNLVGLINKTFKGINYLIVVSPNINITRTQRIETFIENMMDVGLNKNLLLSQTKSAGEWIRTWSKVIRVFKVEL